MITAMLDSNTFDYIYENDLTNKLRDLTRREKIRLFITHVQKNEISKIKDLKKREYALNAIKTIPIDKVLTSAAIVGPEDSKHGFIGSQIGEARIVSETGAFELHDLTKHNMVNPLKNSADLLILLTAIDENLDYLITQNTNDFEFELETMKKTRDDVKLKLLKNNEIAHILV